MNIFRPSYRPSGRGTGQEKDRNKIKHWQGHKTARSALDLYEMNYVNTQYSDEDFK